MSGTTAQIGDRVRYWHLEPRPTSLDGALGTILALELVGGMHPYARIRPDNGDSDKYLFQHAVEGFRLVRPDEEHA